MSLIHFFLGLILINVNWAQNDNLVELNFQIREERIPAIINYVLNNSLEEHGVTTGDIITLSKLDRYNLEETLQVIRYFNTTPEEVFTVDNLEHSLKSLNLTFNQFYNNLTTNLGLSSTDTRGVVEALNIPLLNFYMSLSDNNDEEVYAILKSGIYDQEHVNAALDVSGKSANEVYATARNIIYNQVLQIPSPEFMGILKTHGWNRKAAVSWYKALNITTRDVYDVEKFRIIFTNITDSVNQDLVLGFFVGGTSLVVHEDAYLKYSSKVDGVTFKATANGAEVSVTKNKNVGLRIVELLLKESRESSIEIVTNYTNTNNSCHYQTPNAFIEVEVDLEELSIAKPENGEFYLGAALICDDFLYGLAGREDSSRIFFDGFFTEDSPRPPPEDDEHSQGHISSPTSIILAINLLMIFILF